LGSSTPRHVWSVPCAQFCLESGGIIPPEFKTG